MSAKEPQIPIVYDTKLGISILIESLNLNSQSKLQDIRYQALSKEFLCESCREPVRLLSRRNDYASGGHTYYFKHPAGTGLTCLWKSTNATPGEVYRGIQEGRRHIKMKLLLKDTLEQLDHWKIKDIDTEFIFSADRSKRRKPDMHAQFKGENIAIEVQLRSDNVETIVNRHKFYQDKGWCLLWLSLEGSELVSEDRKEDCKVIRQVHKDIAFLNRGNWMIFNEELSKQSIEHNQLTLLAKIWSGKIVGSGIHNYWRDEVVHYEELHHQDGELFYEDSLEVEKRLKTELAEEGYRKATALIKNSKAPNWDSFRSSLLNVWPTWNEWEDQYGLKEQFEERLEHRVLKVKKTIVRFFRDEDNDLSHTKWIEMARQLEHLNFGVSKENNLEVFNKILLILGYTLSDYLGPKTRRYVQSCHLFLDVDKHEKYAKYQPLCEEAIQLSPYRDAINSDKSIIKRQHQRNVIHKGVTDIDRLFEWFTSAPVLPADPSYYA